MTEVKIEHTTYLMVLTGFLVIGFGMGYLAFHVPTVPVEPANPFQEPISAPIEACQGCFDTEEEPAEIVLSVGVVFTSKQMQAIIELRKKLSYAEELLGYQIGVDCTDIESKRGSDFFCTLYRKDVYESVEIKDANSQSITIKWFEMVR